MCAMGLAYEQGRGVEQSWEEAVTWYRRGAEKGNGRALGNLAWCYDQGKGVEQDKELAAKYFIQGAEAGSVRCMYCAGWIYSTGDGVPRDEKKGFFWYEQAALRGHDRAMVNLGFAYNYGHGTTVDHEKAVELYRMAAERGNYWGMNNLGDHYLRGQGVERDLEQAEYWLEKAVQFGPAVVKYNLGALYEAQERYSDAIRQYETAEAEGNENACWALGRFYQSGIVVQPDAEKAFSYYEKGAQLNDTNCRCRLAWCFAEGFGTERDPDRARALCQDILKKGYQVNELDDFGTREELRRTKALWKQLKDK